jgi:hypothetical protein
MEFMCCDYSFVIVCCDSNQTHACEMNISNCESTRTLGGDRDGVEGGDRIGTGVGVHRGLGLGHPLVSGGITTLD